ncbi:AAA family ATPase [Streptomyces sp. NPDC126514]|uniref:helix-turn-helix transcriptional regulator n=1 Tax=Streptomyces sp. NPDC126514 TaxID=3155210 RepID=UPI0033333BED
MIPKSITAGTAERCRVRGGHTSMRSSSAEFVGRETQLGALNACAGQAAEGMPSLIMVEGEAGIGKTALVRAAVSGLDDFSCLWSTCDETEQDYQLGVLEQFVRQVPRGELREHELLLRVTEQSSPLEVGAQLLRLLGTLEERRPVALVVDDIQWIDEASMRVLRFLTRRWWTERLLLAVTRRTPPPGTPPGQEGPGIQHELERLVASAERATVVALGGFSRAEVHKLAQAVGVTGLSTEIADRLHAHTAGHPLYLRSLITEASVQDLADPQRSMPVPQSLAATVRQTLSRLDRDSRLLVESLAVLDTQVPLAVAAEVAGLPDAVQALGPALASGLVEWQPQAPSTPLRLRHKLQRDAVYEGIEPSRRKLLHAAAAKLSSASAYWAHRVAATAQADDGLARELDGEAERNVAAGHNARAATLLLWACDLSTRPQDRQRRRLAAAVQLMQASDYQRGWSLETSLRQCAPSAMQSGVLGRLAFGRGDYGEAERLLRRAVEQAQSAGDTRTAAHVLSWLGGVYVALNRAADALPVLRRALDLGLPDPRFTGYTEYMWVLASEWTDEALMTLREFNARHPELPEAAEEVPLQDSLLLRARSIARGAMGHLHSATQDLSVLTKRQRDGAVGDARAADYFMVASHQYWAGMWEDALLNAERALGLAATNGPLSGRAPGHAVACMVAAGQGRWQAADDHCQASTEAAHRSGVFSDSIYPPMAAAVRAQAREDTEGMYRALKPIEDGPLIGSVLSWRLIWLPLFAQGQIGVGELDQAQHTLHRTRALDVPSLRVGLLWLEGLLAEGRHDPESAERCYREGVELPPAPDDIPLHRAFIEHAYGRFLHARGTTRPATEHLLSARRRYEQLGAVPFSLQVQRDLPSAKAHVASSSPLGTLAELTERERAIAHLAARGLTNQEIAKELYVSAKTVEYHLSHVYAKLSLTSRRQLRFLWEPVG